MSLGDLKPLTLGGTDAPEVLRHSDPQMTAALSAQGASGFARRCVLHAAEGLGGGRSQIREDRTGSLKVK